MKKLLFLAFVITICASCKWKDKVQPPAFEILTKYKWKVESVVYGNVDSGADCRVPQAVYFDKDSTGYFDYPLLCDSSQSHHRSFKYRISTDNKNLYMTNLDGNPKSVYTLGISAYDNEQLWMRSPLHEGRFLGGHYLANGERDK